MTFEAALLRHAADAPARGRDGDAPADWAPAMATLECLLHCPRGLSPALGGGGTLEVALLASFCRISAALPPSPRLPEPFHGVVHLVVLRVLDNWPQLARVPGPPPLRDCERAMLGEAHPSAEQVRPYIAPYVASYIAPYLTPI